MTHLKHAILLPVILVALATHAQTTPPKRDTLVRHLGTNLQPVSQNQAEYETVCLITHMPDNILMFQDFYGKTGKKLQIYFMNATDSQKTGRYEAFYPNGATRRKGYYKNDKQFGTWTEWYENGKPKASNTFDDNYELIESRNWYETGILKDSINFSTDPDSTFEFYETGELWGEGPVRRGRKTGTWKYRYPSGKSCTIEEYEAGELVSAECFNEDGSKSKTCVPEQEASFPGGYTRWYEIIQKKLADQSKELFERKASGSVTVDFVIEPDGRIGNVKILKSSGTALDEYVFNAIKSAPRWTPAIKHNLKVRAYRRQSISFSFHSNS